MFSVEVCLVENPTLKMSVLPAVFGAWVEDTPEALAIIAPDGELSYRELDRRADCLARHLQGLGVGPEVVVGVALERTPRSIITLLAVIKAGGAYLPLDAEHPVERLRFMLEDSQAAVLVTEPGLAERFTGFAGAWVDPADFEGTEAFEVQGATALRPVALSPEHLLYVIYTSGSTGRPKGVAVTHGNVIQLALETRFSALRPEHRMAQVANQSFDAATLEVWGALLNGAALVLIPPAVVRSPRELATALRRHGVTHLFLTPALFNEVVRQEPTAFTGMVQVSCGGEAADPRRVRQAMRQSAPERVANAYGPTECTAVCVWQVADESVVPEGASSMPIGEPMEGTEAYLAALDDPAFAAAGDGEEGELLLGGGQLARGYLHRPALTAERWVPHPNPRQPGERLYRSGDLVRRDGRGRIDFLGRRDTQVKVRGFRIELGEIEARLAEHPAVAAAVVEVRHGGRGDGENRRLVAYLATDLATDWEDGQGAVPVAASAFTAHLAEKLPPYMVPSAFVWMPRFPLTANGKVDRRALPDPPADRPFDDGEGHPWVAPRTPLEERLVALWEDMLGLRGVGVEDDLFALGGHSLLATRMASELRDQLRTEVPLAALFEHSTPAALAAFLTPLLETRGGAQVPGGSVTIPRAERQGDLPLSYSQERVWFLMQLHPGNLAYQFQAALGFQGSLNPAALAWSLAEIVRRHEIFRTTFPEKAGRPVQVIHPPPRSVALPVIDLSALPAAVRRREARRVLRQGYGRYLPADRLPLLYWALLRLGPEEHQLLHVEHHLIHDGWSFNIFLEELAALYRAAVEGGPGRVSPLPELALQFADYAVWQRGWVEGPEVARQLDYWRETLSPPPPLLTLPLDRPRPRRARFEGDQIRWQLPAEDARALRALSRRRGTTLFVTLLTAFLTLLQRATGERDLSVGTGIANRRWREIERLVGMVINNLVLRTDASGDPSFAALLERVQRVTREASAHQDAPFEKVVEAVRPDRDAGHNPLFQTFFSFHDAPLAGAELPDLEMETVLGLPNGSAKFDLNVIVVLPQEQRLGQGGAGVDEGLTFLWEYSTALLDRTTVQRAIGRYHRLLRAVLAGAEDTPLSRLPLLGAVERHQLMHEWNDAAVAFAPQTIHGLVQQQAARTPDAVAVECEGEVLRYRELHQAASRLAHALQTRGVGPEVPVAVSVERSPELVIALLGVLYAGGAYVPLDPAYPEERLRGLLADTGAVQVLVHGATRERLAALCPAERFFHLEGATDPRTALGHLPTTPPDSGVGPDHLAYIIYTSGSTGRPKGAMNAHRGVVNRLQWGVRAFGFGPGEAVLQKTPFSFDVSVWEFFSPLITGARLVLARPGGHREPAYLARLLVSAGITTAHFVPSMLRAFLAYLESAPEEERGDLHAGSLRRVIASGEALDPDLVRRFAELVGVPLFNLYGPTEAAIEVTAHRCLPTDNPVPIGRPVANARIDVVAPDAPAAGPAPIGVHGELLIGGTPVARGYWRDPARTAAVFVPDPAIPGGRRYRSGDLARHRADGVVEFLGRLDHQVKVRGFRVELGEIEAALAAHPAVHGAAVLVRDDNLVAFYRPQDGMPEGGLGEAGRGENDEAAALQGYLRRKLPEHMVPALFHPLPELPLGPTGKVDRRALERLEVAAAGTRRAEYVAPRNEIEELLVEIWRELLPRLADQPVGVLDSFFDLGGHSLHATRLMFRIRELLEVELPVATLYDAPTVERLARTIEAVLIEESLEAEAEDGAAALAGAAAGA
jgi:amino acid adenylation domain-containing protein